MDWQLHFGHRPPWFVLAVLGLALALALRELWLVWREPQRESGELRRAVGLAGARVGALVLVGAMLAELGLAIPDDLALRSRVAVLFDASASMDTRADPAKPDSRWSRARQHWLDNAGMMPHWREEGLAPHLHTFGRGLDPIEGPTPPETSPGEPGSRLGAALSRLDELGRKRSTPLASVVVYSDGLVSMDDAAREALFEDALALGVPINTVWSAEKGLRDLSVGELSVGEFAFVENVTTVEAELFGHGLTNEQVEVELRREGELVSTRRITMDDRGSQRVSFEFAPESTGHFAYELVARPVDGEVNLSNNRRTFVLKVLRDKIRVLHVAGRPDWDVRSLRTLMRRDPNVELLSYYILRDEEDSLRDDADAPMSLIAFPTQELFHEQLGSFDLIILHNFDALTHGNYLDNLARYVKDGGSLVLIGGDLGLATGDYAASPLAPYLPVHTENGGLDRAPFVPSLSETGRRHPITSWLAQGSERSQGLTELDSFNPSRLRESGEAPGGALLLGPNGAPLLSVSEPGKGRTLVLSTGASWRLGFAPDLELIDGARPYDLLWLGIIRWALRDDSADRLSVQSDKLEYLPGEAVTISARTSSASYQPEAGVELHWSVRRLSSDDAPPTAAGSEPPGEGNWTTDALGRASEQLESLPVGAYVLEVERTGTTLENDDSARRVFVVSGGGAELARLDPRPGETLLRDLAERTGGAFLDLRDDALPTKLPHRVAPGSTSSRVHHQPLWSTWPFALALLSLLGLEWYLRRRAGLR